MSILKEKIIEKIRKEGPVSFETFMKMALYYPGLGYYMKDSTRIGKAGDFYTSPHLHPLFGAMLGRQMEEMWEVLLRPERFRIVEMGAGMGYLAGDLLDYLRDREIFRHIDYSIVEMNPAMREQQRKLLEGSGADIRWFSDLKGVGEVTGCFLSNELLDAFPVRIVEQAEELVEIRVDVQEDAFVEVPGPADGECRAYFREFAPRLPHGYRTEINLRIRDWLHDVSRCLRSGFLLTIDYGYTAEEYYSEDRSRGTLLCYYRHQISENPYRHIGEQDITAHVNFSSLKKWGEELGFSTAGYCPQGTYLVALGIDEVLREKYGDAPDPFEIAKIKGLIFPQGMGESHQVMLQYRGAGVPSLRGFSLRNKAKNL
ncbi:MAG: SAM-dependent methyltransferase [Alphaproteobacteria bacterium]|uniref:SAM-dependent methyltransferase n=1 Tax=Candidatus Nitrobium versatile TaxID=2884831 RepID=A0A953JCQ7_9BACT|nr:SAM-dependent methyltransferase [Candidatus Nitrobium versatile]